MENIHTKIPLFRSLFKGREDIFATRWEKDKKGGYMPAYFFDPYLMILEPPILMNINELWNQ